MDEHPFHFEIPQFGESGSPAGSPTPPGKAAEPPAAHGPAAESLTGAEVREVRQLLSLLGPGWIGRLTGAGTAVSTASDGGTPRPAPPPVAPPAGSAGRLPPKHSPPAPGEEGPLPDFPPPTPAPATAPGGPKAALMQLWGRLSLRPTEQEAGETFRRLLEEIPEEPHFARIFTALAGVFPVQQSLRHNTPDQNLAVLTTITDRFLAHLAGLEFEARRRLVRAVAKFASDLAVTNTFVSPEGDPFNNSTCERVEGSNPGSRVIREIHGFVIVRKSSGEVFRLGRALT